MPDQPELLDVSDMISVHEAFRRGLGDAPDQIARIGDGDTERAARLAGYLDELLSLLHGHHAGEDELLYPLLVERVPGQQDLFVEMLSQHAAIEAQFEAAAAAAAQYRASASAADGQQLAAAGTALLGVLGGHLSDEEAQVLPLAAQHISPPEWGALPAHAMMSYTGTRIWMPFGLATEAMAAEQRASTVDHLPPPMQEMWHGGGSDAFTAEMAAIRR